MNTQTSGEQKSIIRSVIGLIVLILYSISKYYFFLGIGLLFILALTGEIHVQNAGILALGILMFFPLRYLNKRLNGKSYGQAKD